LVIKYFEDKIIPPTKYRDLMIFLTITFKGLSLREILSLIRISESEWNLLLLFFKPYFFTYNGLWNISNEQFKHIINELYLPSSQHESTLFIREYHIRIGEEMNNSPNCIRKLEEQTIHYFLSQQHFLLKQTISDIESFLLLFNPYTKYDLCRYWQFLEDRGYDPVVEYNKRLESFDLHYTPLPRELFTIILQISRFFKEFAEFETRSTPAFRHPYIKGKVVQGGQTDQMDSSGPVDIFSFLNPDSTLSPVSPSPHPLGIFQLDDEEMDDIAEHTNNGKSDQRDNVTEYLESIGLLDEINKMSMTATITTTDSKGDMSIQPASPYISDHEKLNVAIPNKQVQFKKHFQDEIETSRQKKALIDPQQMEDISQANGHIDDPHRYIPIISLFEGSASPETNFDDALKVMSEIDLHIESIKPPSFYYYKRWLWIMFPWACLQNDSNFNFSSMISKCYSSNIRYLSVAEDKLLTNRRLALIRLSENSQRNKGQKG